MSDQTKRKYDSTVARIAGNLLSGYRPQTDPWAERDAVTWAVALARGIVSEVQRTDPQEP